MSRNNSDYPSNIAEVVNANFKFRKGVIAAAKRYAQSAPWTGIRRKRVQKLKRFFVEVCAIYGTGPPLLNIRGLGSGDSSGSAYVPFCKTIFLCGRLSVVTSLHELGHHLGMNERQACQWSLNLFRRVWPKQFSKCVADGHVLRKP